jgi:hypothetical protein
MLVSRTMVVHLVLEPRISPWIFEKNWNGRNGILRCLGETDSWKKQKSKISWHCLFNRAQSQDPSIPAHVWLHSTHWAKQKRVFIIIIWNIFTIFYGPSEKCQALCSVNCILVSNSEFLHLLCSMCWTGQEPVLLRCCWSRQWSQEDNKKFHLKKSEPSPSVGDVWRGDGHLLFLHLSLHLLYSPHTFPFLLLLHRPETIF